MIFAANAPSGSGTGFLPLLVAGFAALVYFMMVRPQARRRKEMARMQDELAAGAEVITIGGLHGTVVSVDDDSVTLEVAPGVTNRYVRGAIAKITSGADLPAEATDPDGADVATSEEPAEVGSTDSAGATGKELR